MSKVVVLDNGHGGVIGGIYQTAGKRSPNWNLGVLYEGMFNRWVVNRLIEKLDRASIPYYHISPELIDVTLEERVKRIDNIYKSNKNIYLLSIHANAGGGVDIEGFTTVGQDNSDIISEMFLKDLEINLKEQSIRMDLKDGDKDKEEAFYVLRKPLSPAFLLECGFMDNEVDYKRLWSEDYLNKLVNSLFLTIKKIYEG